MTVFRPQMLGERQCHGVKDAHAVIFAFPGLALRWQAVAEFLWKAGGDDSVRWCV